MRLDTAVYLGIIAILLIASAAGLLVAHLLGR